MSSLMKKHLMEKGCSHFENSPSFVIMRINTVLISTNCVCFLLFQSIQYKQTSQHDVIKNKKLNLTTLEGTGRSILL